MGLKRHGEAVHAVAQPGRLRPVIEDVAQMPAAAAAMHGGAVHAPGAVAFLGRWHVRSGASRSLGQSSVPLSNLVDEENRSRSQPAQVKTPVRRCSCSRGLVKGVSVAAWRSTAYWSGVSSWRHSASVRVTAKAGVSTAPLRRGSNTFGYKPGRPRWPHWCVSIEPSGHHGLNLPSRRIRSGQCPAGSKFHPHFRGSELSFYARNFGKSPLCDPCDGRLTADLRGGSPGGPETQNAGGLEAPKL